MDTLLLQQQQQLPHPQLQPLSGYEMGGGATGGVISAAAVAAVRVSGMPWVDLRYAGDDPGSAATFAALLDGKCRYVAPQELAAHPAPPIATVSVGGAAGARRRRGKEGVGDAAAAAAAGAAVAAADPASAPGGLLAFFVSDVHRRLLWSCAQTRFPAGYHQVLAGAFQQLFPEFVSAFVSPRRAFSWMEVEVLDVRFLTELHALFAAAAAK